MAVSGDIVKRPNIEYSVPKPDRIRINVSYMRQYNGDPEFNAHNKNACAIACVGMVADFDGRSYSLDELRAMVPLNDSVQPTMREEVARLAGALGYEATFLANGSAIVGNGDAEVRDWTKTERIADVRYTATRLMHRNGKGRITAQGLLEQRRRPVIIGKGGHAVLLVGVDGENRPLVHDPAIGAYLWYGTPAHGSGRPSDIIILERV